jgi:hypothetical protein
MTLLDRIILLITGLVAIYLIWRFYTRYTQSKKLHDVYYLMGFIVLLVSGLLLIALGWDILASPYVLTVASLIPLGISLGIMNQYYPGTKKVFSWFALIGILVIAVTSISASPIKKIAVPLFHGVAGLIIFGAPMKLSLDGKAPKSFWWVGVGGALIGLGGIALSFLTAGSQLLFFSQAFILQILAPLLLLMTLAFTWGFVKQITGEDKPTIQETI